MFSLIIYFFLSAADGCKDVGVKKISSDDAGDVESALGDVSEPDRNRRILFP
jgi:hypothetical protein